MNSKLTNEISQIKKKRDREKKAKKIIRLIVLFILISLLILFIVFGVIYNDGSFAIVLDRELYVKNGIIIYDDPDYKVFRTELYADTLNHLDNISETWLPENLHERSNGSHNGENFVAYTFYVENTGEEISDYYSEIIIDNVIKNVDEAIRVRLYKDAKEITFAKLASNGLPEPKTKPFENETLINRTHEQNFVPGDIHKYTIVMWLEGSDPECTDNILGGEFKIHMDFKSEIIK